MNFKLFVFILILGKVSLGSTSKPRKTLPKRKPFDYDVTIVGKLKYCDGLYRIPIWVMDHLYKDLKINFKATNPQAIDLQNVSPAVQEIVSRPERPGRVAFFIDLLGLAEKPEDALSSSKIKIAYLMIETDAPPPSWVSIINNKFDALVVPDKFLVSVFEKAGVEIPIFVLPCGLYLQKLLEQPLKKRAHTPFTFGLSAGFYERKNHLLLLKAFAEEFSNNPGVRLIMHGRVTGHPQERETVKKIQELINRLKLTNVKCIFKSLSEAEYIDLLKSIDVVASFSKGEGFSILPREAFALGIPVVLSDHTAHSTICSSGLAACVPAPLIEKMYHPFFNTYSGNNFNAHIRDAKKALRRVYDNYGHYLSQAPQRRRWVLRYSDGAIKQKFINLIKPSRFTLGNKNAITDKGLITKSKKFFNKLSSAFKNRA